MPEHGLACGVFAMTLLSLPALAWAQADADRATARALGLEGSQALDNKEYATAEDRFRRADKLVHAPTLMLGLARALAGEGKYVEATETYNRIVREGVAPRAPEPFKRALVDANKEVDEVAPKIASVTILVEAPGGAEVPGARAVLDGTPLNSASMGVRRLVDPGAHTLTVRADGFKPAELRFTVLPGGSLQEPVRLEPAPAPVPAPPSGAPPALAPPMSTGPATVTVPERPEPPARKPSALPWVAFGVGAAGLAVGTATGIVAMGQSSELQKACTSQRVCPTDRRSDVDAYRTMGAVADVGFAVAGVGVAAGVVLLLTQPKTEHERSPAAEPARPPGTTGLRLTPVFGLGSAGIIGQF